MVALFNDIDDMNIYYNYTMKKIPKVSLLSKN